MLQIKPNPLEEPESVSGPAPMANVLPLNARELAANAINPVTAVSAHPQRKVNQPLFPAQRVAEGQAMQTRMPAIIGDATFRGTVLADGLICGQPGNSGSLTVRQRGRSVFGSEPELNGEISFVDMIRVNGHIAGRVTSRKGTLIVDTAARVEADIEVAIAVINGTVTGDIVAHQKVELAPTAKIYGNIWTRSLAIQNGAIFEGVCQMLEEKEEGH